MNTPLNLFVHTKIHSFTEKYFYKISLYWKTLLWMTLHNFGFWSILTPHIFETVTVIHICCNTPENIFQSISMEKNSIQMRYKNKNVGHFWFPLIPFIWVSIIVKQYLFEKLTRAGNVIRNLQNQKIIKIRFKIKLGQVSEIKKNSSPVQCLQVWSYYYLNSVSPTNKTDGYDITEILLKVTLNTITIIPIWTVS